MPLYNYRCDCGKGFTAFRPMAECAFPSPCPLCGALAERTLSAPRIISDLQGYTCPITDKWVEGRRAHEENLRRHDCRVLEPGEKEAAERFRRAEEASLDRAVEATVEQSLASMSSTKLEHLTREIDAGASTTFTRS